MAVKAFNLGTPLGQSGGRFQSLPAQDGFVREAIRGKALPTIFPGVWQPTRSFTVKNGDHSTFGKFCLGAHTIQHSQVQSCIKNARQSAAFIKDRMTEQKLAYGAVTRPDSSDVKSFVLRTRWKWA